MWPFKQTEFDESYSAQLTAQQQYSKQLRDIIDDDAARAKVQSKNCQVVIDWAGMRVVSIERMYKDRDEVTILGYIDTNGCVSEWTLWCTEAQHEKLCNEFINYLKVKP